MKLKDKVVVVTGSTRGMGRAIAEACAKEGSRVVICSRKKSAVERTVKDLKDRGFQATGIAVDVSSQYDLEKLLKHAIDSWGHVDVWINNAGLSGPYKPLDEIAPDQIQDVVNTNLTGILLACRLVINYFQEHPGILINTSGKGARGDASPYTTVYAATKAAVTSLTKSLAQENKSHPISIHCVLPGMVKTDFYENMEVSEKLAESARSIPYVLKAIGVPVEVVGRLFAEIAAQDPGRVTGKTYSLFKGWRMAKGISTFMWYRLTGKIKTAQ